MQPARDLVRPVAPADLPEINRLLDRVWFARRTEAGFDWLCNRNPGQSGQPAGWVAEDSAGKVRAFVGNFVQRGWLRGDAHLIASGYNFVSDHEHGGRALGLLRTCIKQDAAALVHTLTANPLSSRLYSAIRLTPYPETGTLKLDWMTQPVVAAIGALSWRAHGLAGQKLIRRLPDIARPAPDVDAILTAHGGEVVRIIRPETDARLATFDQALRQGPRLYAERSPEALHWRLSDPDDPVPPVLIAYPATGAIRGTALFQFNKPSEAEPPYLDAVDLVTLDPGDAGAVQALMQAGLALARGAGAARLRLSMVTPVLLGLLGPLADRARKTVSHKPHAFFKPSAALADLNALSWQPLPYDGESGPSLRPWRVR
jgi:hypothetical protein